MKGGIRNDGDVRGESLAFAHERLIEVGRADLFLALHHDRHIHRKATADAQVSFERREMHEDLPLVVGTSATVHLAVAYAQRKRGCRPERLRIGGLHVVMTVDQQRRRTGMRVMATVGDGMTARFEDRGLEAEIA